MVRTRSPDPTNPSPGQLQRCHRALLELIYILIHTRFFFLLELKLNNDCLRRLIEDALEVEAMFRQ